jgi:hypothetical protein
LLDEIQLSDLSAVDELILQKFLVDAAALIGAPKPGRQSPDATVGKLPPSVHSLATLVRLVASAAQGERNNLTFWAACRAGELVAAKLLSAATAAAVILEAAKRAGVPDAEAMATVCSGLRTGQEARRAW